MKTKVKRPKRIVKPTIQEQIDALKKEIEELKRRPVIKWPEPECEPFVNPFPWIGELRPLKKPDNP